MGHTMGFSLWYGLPNVLPRPTISSDTPTGPNVLRNLTPSQFCFRGFGPSPSFSSQPIFAFSLLILSVSLSLCLSLSLSLSMYLLLRTYVTEPKAQSRSSQLKPLASYHAFYTDANAGMEGVDKERMQAIEQSKSTLDHELQRDLSRIWPHVDMDAFHAAVETLCNPALQGKPMAVDSMSTTSTGNNEARKFGVWAALPGFMASKLSPFMLLMT
ncbi:unnamed protein product [Coffea canephora]|uniref:UmuC domain-containing protein n=1 Tax=Coffea canephora TaxID=49390 RepID=A0A068TMW5_COFCA|nr:unnamed protein product [Coffea canephora]